MVFYITASFVVDSDSADEAKKVLETALRPVGNYGIEKVELALDCAGEPPEISDKLMSEFMALDNETEGEPVLGDVLIGYNQELEALISLYGKDTPLSWFF